MRIDPKSSVPIFQQIADQTRSSIRRGVLRPGEILPSLRALAVEIQVNPNTVQRAYELLEREGVVQSRKGVGVFVSEHASGPAQSGELSVTRTFEKAIRNSLNDGLPPERIRTLFEAAMHNELRKVQS
jgi:GntR family transcriptional regulator